MTKKKAAELFNVSEKYIDKMIKERKLPKDLNDYAVYEVLLEFKAEQNEALQQLADMAEELGLEYE